MAQCESILVAMIVSENGTGTKVTPYSLNKVPLCGPNTLWLFMLWNYVVEFAGFFAGLTVCSQLWNTALTNRYSSSRNSSFHFNDMDGNQ